MNILLGLVGLVLVLEFSQGNTIEKVCVARSGQRLLLSLPQIFDIDEGLKGCADRLK
jgi:hypothetical protein